MGREGTSWSAGMLEKRAICVCWIVIDDWRGTNGEIHDLLTG